MLSNFTKAGQSRSIIFPEDPKADGWFSVGKMLKELLIEANKPLPRKKHSSPRFDSMNVNGPPTFANVVRGGSGPSLNSALKGWRCRTCGSWDIFAGVIGDKFGVSKESIGCSQMNFREEARCVDGDKQNDSNTNADCVSVSPGLNNFQVLRDLRETYPCSDCELTSCNQDGSTTVVPESPSKVMTPTLYSSQKMSKELTVYTRRRNRGNFFAVPNFGLRHRSFRRSKKDSLLSFSPRQVWTFHFPHRML